MAEQQNLQTVKGFVVVLPKQGGAEDAAKVAVLDDNGVEFHILPRGMGIDLVDHINAGVEVVGTVQEKDDVRYMHVRNYKVQDDYEDHWYDDDNE